MNIDPLAILNLLKSGNPKNAVLQLAQNNNDLTIRNLIQMAQSGNMNGVQQFAENFFRQRGTDLNTQMNIFMNSLNGK